MDNLVIDHAHSCVTWKTFSWHLTYFYFSPGVENRLIHRYGPFAFTVQYLHLEDINLALVDLLRCAIDTLPWPGWPVLHLSGSLRLLRGHHLHSYKIILKVWDNIIQVVNNIQKVPLIFGQHRFDKIGWTRGSKKELNSSGHFESIWNHYHWHRY